MKSVRDVLETHAENIGDADGEEERDARRGKVVKLLVAIGGGREGDDDDDDAAGGGGGRRRRRRRRRWRGATAARFNPPTTRDATRAL